MDSFQQDLGDSGLELIAAEIVQDNPKLHVTNLKVSLSNSFDFLPNSLIIF